MQSLQEWFSSDDYPPEAMKEGAEGTVEVRLTIDAGGQVTGCEVTQSSKSAALDSRTCELLRARGRFRPARDASGRAVSDVVPQRISWRMEDVDWVLFAPAHVVTRVFTSPRGISHCTVEVNGEPATTLQRGECVAEIGQDFADMLDQTGTVGRLSLVYSFTPAGVEALAANTSSLGRLVLETEAEVRIGANGLVESCHVVLNRAPGFPEGPPASETCSGLQFEPAPGGGGRRGRVRQAVHLDVGQEI